jgi:gamma-glutamylputrescine oxidase
MSWGRQTRITGNISTTFSNRRHPSGLGKVIGKPLLYSLSNTWAKFYQVDTLRSLDQTEKEF